MKVSFGRCNIPHLGHKHLIDACDTFVLSNGKNNLPVDTRVKILNELGVQKSKLVVGNPFREISKILDNNSNVDIYYTDDNYSLVKVFTGKANLVLMEKQNGLSSTKIRKLLSEGYDQEVLLLYDNNIELYKLVKEQFIYETAIK
jgi:hypothetical protein